MKKKKYLLLFLLILMCAFTFNINVYAESSYSSSSEGKIIFKTEIRNWTPVNDLIWHGENKCEGKSCTYSAYLVGQGYNGTETVNNLKVDLPTDENSNLGFDLSKNNYTEGEWEEWEEYQYKFIAGTTVTLYEVFEFDSGCSEGGLCVGEQIETIDYNLSNNLYFTFNDNDVIEKSVLNCENYGEYNSRSYSIYRDVVIPNYSGDYYSTTEYTYIDDEGKSNIIDNGYIALPIYYVRFDFSYKGNLMSRGSGVVVSDFNVSMTEISFDNGTTCTDGYNCSHIISLGGDGYSIMNYEQFSSFKNSDPSMYKVTDDDFKVNSSIETSYRYGGSSGCDISRYNNEPDSILITCDAIRNASVPNGLFYNILPFIIILTIGGVGIIILKKNKMKNN